MYNKRFKRGKGKFVFALFFPLLWLLLSAVVMWLWNAILPSLLHANTITYWQSVGLLLLCRILFGGFHFRPSGGNARFGNRWGEMRENMRDKWKNMSEEERAKFRSEMRNRCKPREEKKKENE